MSSPGDDLRAFIDASPSPFHAVAEIARRLGEAGFTELDETERWRLSPGGEHLVSRYGGSIVAFRVGSALLADAGIGGIGTHAVPPTLRVRPHHDLRRVGYKLVGVEPYGGMLAHTWVDRELTVAGRVTRADGTTTLARLVGATPPIPSPAIHLDRSVPDGLTLDPQRQPVP